MTHSTYNITQEVTVSEGSVECVTKTEGVAAITTTRTVTMTKGTPMASGGKAAVQIGGVKAGDIDITDWWDGGYDAGWKAAAALCPTTIAGSDQSVRVPTSTPGSGTDLSLTAVYNAGWNACLAACTAVNDAYKKSGTTTAPYSGSVNAYDSSGSAKSYSYSGNVTIDNYVTYSNLYTLPAAK